MRLVQLTDGTDRRVAVVDEPNLRLLEGVASVYHLAQRAISAEMTLPMLIAQYATGTSLSYDPVYEGTSEWSLLPPLDHPDEPSRCLVSGTGLTHLGSASDREAMHNADPEEMTDSMQMFKWGVEGGRPEPGKVGVPPEWFFKGRGDVLRGHGKPLTVPPYALDGGEEAEVAGLYVIGENGAPHRVGMAPGNEFADHEFEKKNYLNLAGSKIRTCSLGPELVIGPSFESVPGRSVIERAGEEHWRKEFETGESEMCHNLQNLEHHHFKFEPHRLPGDVHIHYFGAHSLSYGDGVRLREGDVMEVRFEGFGRALRNPVSVAEEDESLVTVRSLA